MRRIKEMVSQVFTDREAEQRRMLRKTKRKIQNLIAHYEEKVEHAEEEASHAQERVREALVTGRRERAKSRANRVARKLSRAHRHENIVEMLEVVLDNVEDRGLFGEMIELVDNTSGIKLDFDNVEENLEKFTLRLEDDVVLHDSLSKSLGMAQRVNTRETPRAEVILAEIEAEVGLPSRESRAETDVRTEVDMDSGPSVVEEIRRKLDEKRGG